MKRFDAILKTATFALGTTLSFSAITLADEVQVSRCSTVRSNWPVIMGWQNGTLQPKRIIIEISQENPALIEGGKNFKGFDPRMPFKLELNDPSDAGDYFPEEGLINHNAEVVGTRTTPPRQYQTLLESSYNTKCNFLYSTKIKSRLRSPSRFQIVIQTQSSKNASYYYSSILDCQNTLQN